MKKFSVTSINSLALLLIALGMTATKSLAAYGDIPLTSLDIGLVSAAGSITGGNGYYTIQGGGTGVGGSNDGASDSCQFAYQQQTGDYTCVAQVYTQSTTGEAGIMARQGLDASAPFVEVAYQAGVGTIVQYRAEDGETTVLAANDPTFTIPSEVALVRSGNSFQAYESDPTGGTWTPLGDPLYAPGDWSTSSYLGLVESADNDAILATAEINNFLILPTTYCSSEDIGSPLLVGSTDYEDQTNELYTLVGAGTGIGGKSDQERYTFTWSTGNIDLTVRVASLTATSATAQAGLTVRSSLTSSSPEFSLVLTTSGVNAIWRSTTGGASNSVSITSGPLTAPYYLHLNRTGNVFTVNTSVDGVTWSPDQSVTVVMPAYVNYGMAVSSDSTSSYATATFDSFLGVHN